MDVHRLGHLRLAFAALLLFGCVRQSGAATFIYRGVAYISYSPNDYATPDSAASLTELASTGANWASLLGTWYMNSGTATSMAPDASRSPTDAAVIQAITDMHARGLRVMLKPHVDVEDGTWRGAIAPSDTAAWFASYTTFITHYASIAQAQNVELFCVGCELKTLTGPAYAAQWQAVIQAVRAVYSGPLTYAANAFNVSDEYSALSFWSLLDIAGLDCYSPLTGQNDPTVAALVAAWRKDDYNEDMVGAFRTFQSTVGRPVMFTEMGYQSARGTNITPYYVNVATATPDQQEQANCYEAAMEVFSNEPWCRGIFWWGWQPSLPPPNDADYSARGKLAETVLKNWYSTLNTPPVLSSPITVTPSDAQTGQTITYSAAATDADGEAIFYAWDFGDTMTASGASVTHAYAAAGAYTAVVTVSDGKGGVIAAQATVHIVGAPVTGGPPVPTLPPGGGTGGGSDPVAPVVMVTPFTLTRVAIKLNFARTGKDTIRLSGKLPLATMPPPSLLIVNAGGAVESLQFTAAKTAAQAPSKGSFVLGKPHAGKAAFTLKLNAGSFAANLTGFAPKPAAPSQRIAFTVSLALNNTTYQATRTVTYAARNGTTGMAH